MMTRSKWLVGVPLLLVVGCAADPAPAAARVAVVDRATERTTVVFLNEQNAARASEIVAGSAPTGFQWIAIRVGSAKADELYGTGGTHIDLTNAADATTFQQDYAGPCNPAQGNFDACWLLEEYSAGDPGLTGYIDLTLTTTIANGGLDVSWTGMTDRFGAPTQMLTHDTLMDIAGAIAQPQ